MAMSDLAYDVLTALQSKLEAVAIYEQYIDDCDEAGEDDARQIFEEIMRDDEKHVERLRDLVEQLVRDGKFK